MKIVKASENDIPIIQHLANTIWPKAYGNIISETQIKYMLHLIYSSDALKQQMKKKNQFILVAENYDHIGFAAYSPKINDYKNIYRLHKIYVLPNHPTKGIGSFLLNFIIEDCKANNASTLELNVNKHNTAIEFYTKKGFKILREEVIDIGNGYVMDDYVMALSL